MQLEALSALHALCRAHVSNLVTAVKAKLFALIMGWIGGGAGQPLLGIQTSQ